MTRSRTKRLLIVLPVLLVCLAVASLFHLPSPDGAYYDPNVGCIGDAYWIFERGQLHLQTPESSDLICSYSKGASGWMSTDEKGKSQEFAFTATVFGIKMHTSDGQSQRFMFRRSFAWMPKTWSWIQEHVL